MGSWCGLGKKPWRERSALSSPACDRMPVIPGPWGLFPEKMSRFWNEWSESPIRGVSGSVWTEAAARASRGMEVDFGKSRGQGCVWVPLCPALPAGVGWLGCSCPVWRLCGSGGGLGLWETLARGCRWRVWRAVLVEARGGAGATMRVLLWSELSISLDQCLRFLAPGERDLMAYWKLEKEKSRRHFPGFQTSCPEGSWETRIWERPVLGQREWAWFGRLKVSVLTSGWFSERWLEIWVKLVSLKKKKLSQV